MKRSLVILLALPLLAGAQEAPEPKKETPKALPEKKAAPKVIDPKKIRLKAKETLKFKKITVLKIAKLFEEATGKRIIMPRKVADSEISFSLKGPMTNAEFAKYLKLNLLAEEFAMVPIPDHPDVLRLVPSKIPPGGLK